MSKVIYSKLPALDRPERIFDLRGRCGLITGGAGKMGRQFATVLLRAGARVAIADLDAGHCRQAAAEIHRKTGRRCVAAPACDVADEAQVKALFTALRREFGRLDFLISNVMAKPAGYYRPFKKYSVETWHRVLEANLTGTFLCCREAVRLMRRDASIVITSSTYGIVAPDQDLYSGCSARTNPYGGSYPLNLPAAYPASKGGLVMFGKYLATLLGPKGIRTNILVPGGVYDGQEEAFHREYVRRTPLRRMASWTDFNGAALFLVSDASRYMTGATLVIDGGWTAW